jgi:formamidopyrimidine-DNA glycosylase
MNRELRGKTLESVDLKECEKLQRIGMVQKDDSVFQGLVGGSILSASSRGNTIVTKLDNGMNLVLAPEYGGLVLLHQDPEETPVKYHLRIVFADGTTLTVRQTSMGCIEALPDERLTDSYVYGRDFTRGLDPMSEDFTLGAFSDQLGSKNRALKSVLLGKDAVLVGISNSAFQEVAYIASIHPKRRASDLDEDETKALFESIRNLFPERIRQGGKEEFTDLYGQAGRYRPRMGSAFSGKACPRCGTGIEKLSISGGLTHFCPSCQR